MANMTYAEWLDTLAETARSHELSYDAAAVLRLPPADRARAETHLLDLVGAGDVLAFETVGKLGLAGAIPHLERHRAGTNAWARGAAARALFELRGDPIAADSENSVVRGLDAYALKTSDRPEAIPALFPFLSDPGVHGRVHSAEGLVEKLGLAKLAEPRGSPLRRMMLAQCSHLPTLWPLGAAELRDVLWSVYRGARPEALGLVYVPSADASAMERFWAQCLAHQPFDLEILRGMGPHDRAFAETVLVSRLRSGDVNALLALRELNPPGWRVHLRAAVPFVEKHPQIAKAYDDELASR
jgi:hypothetical protein